MIKPPCVTWSSAGGISAAHCKVSVITFSFSPVKCSPLNISCRVRHRSLASPLVSPFHNWAWSSKPRHTHTWHEAPRGNVTHKAKPKQQTSRHKNEGNGKDEAGDSFQTRIWPITKRHDKRKIAGFLNELSSASMWP